MTFTTEKYFRRPFQVEAVRVTEENLDELAGWCEGRVRQGDPRGSLEKFIYLAKIHTPMNERQKMAFVEDWVLKTDKGFKFYTDQAFHKMFVKGLVGGQTSPAMETDQEGEFDD